MTTSPLLRDLASILAAGYVRLLVNRKKSEMGLASIGDVEASCHRLVNEQRRSTEVNA